MNHKEVLERFGKEFPERRCGKIKTWFPNGKNSIRIRDFSNNEFIFTYNGPNNWKFETVDCFIKYMKGEK